MCLLPEPDIGFGKLNSRECDGMSERDMSNTRGSSELIGQMKRAGTERKPSPVLAVYSLAKRELVRFFRQRTRIVGALGQPIIFWILFGAGLQGSFRGPAGISYQEYFVRASR